MTEYQPTNVPPLIRAFFDELRSLPWFEKVGRPVTSQGVEQVFSLAEAWQCTQDESWTYAPFHGEIDQSHPLWAMAYDIAYEAVEASGRNFELEEGNPIARAAAWDAGGVAYQLATGKPEGFYMKLMEWYRQGHWPCGWRGTYPEGKLIIY